MCAAKDEKTWHLRVPQVIRMLFHIEQYNIDHRDDDDFEELRGFLVIPQPTCERIHITIDTNGLIQMIKSFTPRSQKINVRSFTGANPTNITRNQTLVVANRAAFEERQRFCQRQRFIDWLCENVFKWNAPEASITLCVQCTNSCLFLYV